MRLYNWFVHLLYYDKNKPFYDYFILTAFAYIYIIHSFKRFIFATPFISISHKVHVVVRYFDVN